MKKNKATRKPVLSIFWLENKLHSYYKTYLKGEKKGLQKQGSNLGLL